jgi:small conductance mechanosensitive channel
MENLSQKALEYLAQYGFNVLAALLIFIIGRFVASILSKIIERIVEKSSKDVTLSKFVKHISYIGLLILVIIAAVSKLGVQTASLVAVIGAAGLAVGLALQGSLANFAAGILLIIFKPFKIGDLVEMAGVLGTVKEIHIFCSTVNTLDNRRIVVPNAKITGDNIVNLSDINMRRIDLVFGISYGDDMREAKNALQRVVSSDPRILKEPEPTIAVSELADSSVNLVCRPWVKPEDYWGVYFDVVEKGKLELEKSGITIPFPQRDVHMYAEKQD